MIKSNKGAVAIEGSEDELIPEVVLLLHDLTKCLSVPAIPAILATYYMYKAENDEKVDCKQAMVNFKKDVLVACDFIMHMNDAEGDTIEEKLKNQRKEMGEEDE